MRPVGPYNTGAVGQALPLAPLQFSPLPENFMTDLEILSNQVNCRNSVNAQSSTLSRHLQEYFNDKTGKKIVKFTPYKQFTKAVKDDLDKIAALIEENTSFRIWFETGYSAVWCAVQGSYKVSDCSVNYCKREFHVVCFNKETGVMNDEKREIGEFRSDYTVEEVAEARNKIKALESQLSEIRSQIREISY